MQATTPLNKRRAPLAVNGTRAPLGRKLRDQSELARKAPKTNRSHLSNLHAWDILAKFPAFPGHPRD